MDYAPTNCEIIAPSHLFSSMPVLPPTVFTLRIVTPRLPRPACMIQGLV